MTRWAILTGEYPPQAGGVADYTRLVSLGLASAGDEVHVFAPPLRAGKELDNPGINLVRLKDHFGPRGLVELDHILARLSVDRILIQYVPHAYGWKAMNLLFATWVSTRAWRFAPIWVMFHEVAFPLRWRPLTHALLCAVNRMMARLVAGASERVFSSISAWEPLLKKLCPRVKPIEWLPIPSNVPSDPGIASVRAAPGTVIGHFGTYGQSIVKLLKPTLVSLLGDQSRTVLLLGRGGIEFREEFATQHPQLAGRVFSLNVLPPADIAARLRGCDLLLQPYIDGISTRRTSAMAGLANGVPVVSNLGALSEPLWSSFGSIGLAKAPNPVELAAAAETVLSMEPSERAAMGSRAAILYENLFGLRNTISRLRTPPQGVRA